MSELRADSLSPLDAATLWPQLSRLDTEVVATRSGERLLVTSGMAATGLSNLPRATRTSVLGLRRGLRYRGVIVVRELAGGATWEVVSLRLARDMDREAVRCLVSCAAEDTVKRGGRRITMRYAEGSPHEDDIIGGGLRPYVQETLYALPSNPGPMPASFRPIARPDRAALFRLYNKAVPASIRQQEALTQQEWRAIHGSYDPTKEWVHDAPTGLVAWIGAGTREVRILSDSAEAGIMDDMLQLVESQPTGAATLVIAEYQPELARAAEERGYALMGTRLVSARRMAILNSLKEAVPAGITDTVALPQ